MRKLKTHPHMGAFMPTRDELFAYVKATFGTEPDYPWPQEPEYAVLRHADNGKWYGIVMSVPLSKLGLPGKGNVEIINVKSAQVLDMLLYGDPGILPAYHMNKKHWITILLESGFAEKELRDLLMESYRLTQRRKNGFPANSFPAVQNRWENEGETGRKSPQAEKTSLTAKCGCRYSEPATAARFPS